MKKVICLTILFLYSIPNYAESLKVNSLGRLDISNEYKASNIASSYLASKDTYGMRTNAVVAGFSANSERPFDYPILGFEGIMQLAKYHDRDSVALYVDNTSPPFKPWETISNVTYTPTSFNTIGYDIENLKPGMLVDTLHSPKWSTYIVAVHHNKIVTAGWVNSKTGHLGTPKNGIGLIVNPLTKIWASNFNIFFPNNGRAENGVIQENGIINNNVKNPNAINGLDTVVLPQSKYGGTAAYLARSADRGGKQQWAYGFISQGAKISFISSNSVAHKPDASFHDMSSAYYGIVFDGHNAKSSIVWKDNSGTIVSSIDPNGSIESISYKTKVINDDGYITKDYSRYLVSGKNDITLILPDSKTIIDGFTVKISKLSKNKLTLKPHNHENINNQSDNFILMGTLNKELFFKDGNWYIL
ncbi:hypothetical protein [Klebsiella quasipneumoniae]|uniref:hypothetical protein n=1 Tax=Klebsiella quasipneumoniae TaxID=1463165 RepID=UPI0010361551|nr:hypothetical protein [Klebsiella quasipneumoniae]TBP38617.1 hypothetical protein EXU05_20235 [Klebsiella quasipneumoniae subsp. quasipneumoniae]TBP63330.1 hypothetical protein EXT99_25570 [Klebsiella quasipneumoniae subsp. quasipneumoniae]TBP98677.1 hypothetical protein EXU07_24905 [Klebsiella quasipneumoniae subsp. quasipneumoniae]TBQ62293.1 hypothetical protein EXU11_26635 [Klebsiella quasipneumoniae subsp. quasipneumoniae]